VRRAQYSLGVRSVLAIVLLGACARAKEPELPRADEPSRVRTYLKCDPAPTLARMRRNALSIGCTIEDRSNGTKMSCGDAELWIVPDPDGMEVWCTGMPVNCDQRGHQLMRDDAPKE
jgi:hypothetical protein